MFTRRSFLRSLCRTAVVLPFYDVLSLARPLAGPAALQQKAGEKQQSTAEKISQSLGVSFLDIARSAGLNTKTIFGGEHKNKYLLETTGCGVAFYDYDNDGWLDIFLVNGRRLEESKPEPTCRLFKNNRDSTFTDVTERAGLARSGWGQGVCIGDYDNDGFEDLFVSYFGENALFHNNGDGTFTDVTSNAGVGKNITHWATGCAFVDYDRDGKLDLFVASYINLDLKTAPVPESGPCLYKGIMVACGPPGLEGGKNTLYHNNGDGTFKDVSESAGIRRTGSTYGLGVLTADFDDDGWPDIYVADDSTASALYHNQHDGSFKEIGIEAGVAFSPDGKPQAGMGVSAADYDGDGRLDILKTNFAGDTHSLYRNLGDSFDDVTFSSGLGVNTMYLGWGCGFIDFDNDGWVDVLVTNGHVYPEVEQLKTEAGYAQKKLLYRNLHNGRFEDVTDQGGPGILAPAAGRGCAFGDFDNDGDMDVVVNCVNDYPQLLRCDSALEHNWIKIRTIGTKSNCSGIGARLKCVTLSEDGKPHIQVDEVRSGGSYLSQNDLRIHFGLGTAKRVELLEIRWPSGAVETLKELAPNRLHIVREGEGVIKSVEFAASKTPAKK